jgi:hypothetical protein
MRKMCVWYYEYVKITAISEIHKVSVFILYLQAKSHNHQQLHAIKLCLTEMYLYYFV